MRKLDSKQVLQIITQTAQSYDILLNDKHFLIIYQTQKGVKFSCIGFRSFNYLHFTGIKTNLSANKFYEECLSHKLSDKNIILDNPNKIAQKLLILPHLPSLFYNNCMIGNFIGSGVSIKTDYFAGNTKCTFSVGFKKGNTVDIPVSLYHEDIRKLTNPTFRVISIFCKPYNEIKYNKCTYIAKGQIVSNYPADITDLLDNALLSYSHTPPKKQPALCADR